MIFKASKYDKYIYVSLCIKRDIYDKYRPSQILKQFNDRVGDQEFILAECFHPGIMVDDSIVFSGLSRDEVNITCRELISEKRKEQIVANRIRAERVKDEYWRKMYSNYNNYKIAPYEYQNQGIAPISYSNTEQSSYVSYGAIPRTSHIPLDGDYQIIRRSAEDEMDDYMREWMIQRRDE